MTPRRGEVWLLHLGMVEKVRPDLIVSTSYGDHDRALGSEFEIVIPVALLKTGAFLVQNVATYPIVRAVRKLGVLKVDQFDLVGSGLLRWLRY